MACKVRILPTALDELADAVRHINDESPAAAARLLDQWDQAINRFESADIEYALSRFEPLAKLGYRAFTVGSYIALYYRENEDVVIAHVFHQSRDYTRLVIGTH